MQKYRYLFTLWNEITKSLRSLSTHRLRALLSTLGVLFGVVAVVTMLSIGEGAKQETLEQIAQLGMHNVIIRQTASEEQKHSQGKSRGLTLSDAESLERTVPDIRYQACLKVIESTLTGTLQELSPEILAVTRSFGTMKKLECAEGRFICDQDRKGRHLVCVLGSDVALKLGKDGHVGHTLRIGNVPFQIIGVLKSTHWKASKSKGLGIRNLDKSIFLPLGSEIALPKNKSGQEDLVSEITLQMSPSKGTEMTSKVIKNILSRSHNHVEDYQIVVPRELINQAQRTHQTFNLVLGSIAAISLLVGGIGIMNIMLATVSERTREIGIRRAVGANKRHIITQFLFEAILLTLIGAISGIVVGILFSWIISYLANWKTVITLWSLLISLGMAVGVGIFSGLYPAIKAANMNPINALRHF